MPKRWTTVTVVHPDGSRQSLELKAESTYDAAHLYVTKARENAELLLPVPVLATVFEVVIDQKVYQVKGADLQRWIERQRGELNGPKGMLFMRRPTPDSESLRAPA